MSYKYLGIVDIISMTDCPDAPAPRSRVSPAANSTPSFHLGTTAFINQLQEKGTSRASTTAPSWLRVLPDLSQAQQLPEAGSPPLLPPGAEVLGRLLSPVQLKVEDGEKWSNSSLMPPGLPVPYCCCPSPRTHAQAVAQGKVLRCRAKQVLAAADWSHPCRLLPTAVQRKKDSSFP